MIDSVILKDTKREDWPEIREKILARINKTFGTAPCDMSPMKNDFQELERYTNYGLEHIKIKYHVYDDFGTRQ